MNSMNKARLMLITSMTIFGTIGLFVRNIPVSSGELALYRAVLAAMLIGVYLLVTKQKIPFQNIKKELLEGTGKETKAGQVWRGGGPGRREGER